MLRGNNGIEQSIGSISQHSFVKITEGLLAEAGNPNTAPTRVSENAGRVLNDLAAIEAGRLIVHPPITAEQNVVFQSQATELAEQV